MAIFEVCDYVTVNFEQQTYEEIILLFYSQSVTEFTILDPSASQMNPLHIVVMYLFAFLAGSNCEPLFY